MDAHQDQLVNELLEVTREQQKTIAENEQLETALRGQIKELDPPPPKKNGNRTLAPNGASEIQ
jgi:uncharacterized coiled-coil protein SlyX